jgi:hypothetical protein
MQGSIFFSLRWKKYVNNKKKETNKNLGRVLKVSKTPRFPIE